MKLTGIRSDGTDYTTVKCTVCEQVHYSQEEWISSFIEGMEIN